MELHESKVNEGVWIISFVTYSSRSIYILHVCALYSDVGAVRKPTAGRIWGYLLEEFLSEKCENSFGHCSTILCARGVFGACLLLHIKSQAITYNSTSIASGYDFICFHFFALTRILCSFRNYFRAVKDRIATPVFTVYSRITLTPRH